MSGPRATFDHQELPEIPGLAWCASVIRGNEAIQVQHGSGVDTAADFFFEGAWDGPWEGATWDSTSCLMGSGARRRGQGVLFCSSSHMLERLYLVEGDGALHVSNSLAFLLARAALELDLSFIPVQPLLLRQVTSLDHAVQWLPVANGRRILMVYCNDIHVREDLSWDLEPKQWNCDYSDYSTYRSYLVETLRRLLENANHPARRNQYTPLATVSTGYDSPACAVLARELGCQEAVSIRHARDSFAHALDCGDEIGRLLGYQVKVHESSDFQDLPGTPEAEFMALGDGGQDAVMAPLADSFRGRTVFTGIHGSQAWGPHPLDVAPDIGRSDLSGCSLAEFRLRTGYVHIPLPFIGSQDRPRLNRITRSDEMKPWSVGGDYDRPIARRIVEEAGIPREMFGMEKKAVTVFFTGSQRKLRRKMNPRSFESLLAFYEAHRKERPVLNQWWYTGMYVLYRLYHDLHMLWWQRGSSFAIPCPIPPRYRYCPTLPSFFLHWGQSVLAERYRSAAPRS